VVVSRVARMVLAARQNLGLPVVPMVPQPKLLVPKSFLTFSEKVSSWLL